MQLTQAHLLQAVALAARAHDGQLRKDGKTPYISHPMRVCLVVRDIFGFCDLRMLLTAVLHDVIEDTTTDFDDVEAQFGAEIARWVGLLSKDKRLSEAEREQDYCRELERAPWQVRACKLADMYDNLSDMDMLPRARWPHTIGRLKDYLNCLQAHDAEELHRPLNLVRALLEEREKRDSGSSYGAPQKFCNEPEA
jgi:guanosine-3',5'-bis(diphosphate) 3'-pyrophosphohydrolase